MPKFSADGVEIYYEVTGEGFPLVWSVKGGEKLYQQGGAKLYH